VAISIDWGTKVITVQKADTTLVDAGPPELRSLDIDTFRLALKDLEDSAEGMAHPDTHQHNTEITIGGITYARFIEIINGYTVTFEAGAYGVDLTGANSNVMDVLNMNATQVRSNNSAGLVSLDSIAGSITSIDTYIETIRKLLENKVTRSGDVITIYDDNEIDVWRTIDLANGGRVRLT
jgi:hypothetical protein